MTSNHKAMLQDIEATIKEINFGTEPSNLYDPLNYMMDLGGKRIRPPFGPPELFLVPA